MENTNNNKDKRKEIVRKILIVIAILLILFGAFSMAQYFVGREKATEDTNQLTSTVESTVAVDNDSVKNPIDFKSLQQKNDEIYAWLKVPGTKVDYPIVQNADDDNFYLRHSAMDKSYSSSGAVYTQLLNTTTFKDRVTVIYGHNGYGDTFFTTLHKFEDKTFFDEHSEFIIYTPDSKLTYRIISAFKYDDRHLLNSFDVQSDNVFEEFINMIQEPKSTVKNIRNPIDKEITIDDNIVVLSTCITNQKTSRYLVCGVLVKNEKTN